MSFSINCLEINVPAEERKRQFTSSEYRQMLLYRIHAECQRLSKTKKYSAERIRLLLLILMEELNSRYQRYSSRYSATSRLVNSMDLTIAVDLSALEDQEILRALLKCLMSFR